jgi:NAD(P)-dependent dehydrogenase (short-subunit alcohol dehydrogenase family)
VAEYDVNGKVALVTGAARGIGYETARLLHAAGASVTVLDLDERDTQAAAERIGTDRTLGLGVDVTDCDALEEAVAATVERFGGLDIAVANAGIAPPTATMRVIDADAYERTIEVDLLGVWRTVRAALPQVVERRGHIVVVASVYAFFNGFVNASYAVSKAGVEQMGRALRVELAPHGASASVAYFGFIDTKMVQDGFADPIAHGLEQLQPKFALKRLPPSAAGQAIVDGIERRAPRIVAPRWWRAYSVLRGIINPLFDARMERDARLQELVRDADSDERSQLQIGSVGGPPTS